MTGLELAVVALVVSIASCLQGAMLTTSATTASSRPVMQHLPVAGRGWVNCSTSGSRPEIVPPATTVRVPRLPRLVRIT